MPFELVYSCKILYIVTIFKIMNKFITILMFQHRALKLHALLSYGLDTPLLGVNVCTHMCLTVPLSVHTCICDIICEWCCTFASSCLILVRFVCYITPGRTDNSHFIA